jgi:hypothetical protein
MSCIALGWVGRTLGVASAERNLMLGTPPMVRAQTMSSQRSTRVPPAPTPFAPTHSHPLDIV